MSAKITYVPDPGEPAEIEMFGVKWTADKEISVSDDVAIRLIGHPHFMRDDKAQEREDAEMLAKAQAEAERLEAERKAAQRK